LGALLDASRAANAVVHETFEPSELPSLTGDLLGARAVVLAGGDGAYTAGVTALVHAAEREKQELPPIAFAPGGTVSTTARNWGLRNPLAKYATKLVAQVAEGRANRDVRPSAT
jgi:diacylglycerol kinase family enzyme